MNNFLISRQLLPLLSCFVLVACATSAAVGFGLPLSEGWSRPTPLHFGLYVTPEKNPIIPAERFVGYHTAVDFEVSEQELTEDVPVYAICDGKVLKSEFANGYGGVLVQSCILQKQDVTVLYGHLKTDSLKSEGTDLRKGDLIGILAAHKSAESDGNRKHLHLSIRKGKEVQILGYVQTKKELSQFFNPAKILGIRVTNGPYNVPEMPSSAPTEE